jgi:hypothetical protein
VTENLRRWARPLLIAIWPLFRKALRYAHLKLKLIAKVPTVEQHTKHEGAERETDDIFTAASMRNGLRVPPSLCGRLPFWRGTPVSVVT